jgi:hypothetical protein
MSPDDQHFTYNTVSNEDKELLLANGYIPGELSPEELHTIIVDLRDESSEFTDDSEIVNPDERDGTD